MSDHDREPVRLTPRQEVFVIQYLTNGRDQRDAYRFAYGAHLSNDVARINAIRLLKSRAIRRRIDDVLLRIERKGENTVEQLKEELSRLAFSDIRKVASWGPVLLTDPNSDVAPQWVTRIRTIPSDEIDAATAAAIAEMKNTKDGIHIRMHDKVGALDKLCRMFGLFEQRKAPGDDEGEKERRQVARDEVIRMLQAMARPEPITITSTAEPAKVNDADQS
jgi:phage terminase small subunit